MCVAKNYLKRIRLLDCRINSCMEETQRLRDMLTSITATVKDNPGAGSSGSQDKLGSAVAKIIDLENEMNHDIDEFIDRKRELTKILDSIENADQLEVLHSRYVLYKTFEQIACDMNYTYRNVCYIHEKGLKTVAKIMESMNVK